VRFLVFAVLCLLGAACTVTSAASPPVLEPSDSGIAVDLTLEPAPDSVVRVVENVQEERYVVAGDSASALRTSLNRSGPHSSADGRVYDAATQWGLQWSFRYGDDPGACSLQSGTIEMVAVTTLPQLGASSRLDAASMAAWQHYLDALEMHESGHLEGVRQGVRALQAAMNDSPAMATCAELGSYLNALGNAYQDAIRDADTEYDAATGHGRSQGAVFP
jgi:predicted secreted Zn-dependent protease